MTNTINNSNILKFTSKATLIEHLRTHAKRDDALKVIHTIKKFMIVSVTIDNRTYYTINRRLKSDRPNGVTSWPLEKYLMPLYPLGDTRENKDRKYTRVVNQPTAW